MTTARGTVAQDVSVVVSTMHRPEALGRCLAALRRADVGPAEIVVVDQSMDDRTRAVVMRCVGDGMPIRYHRLATPGLGASQNAGVTMATRPIVAITDDDCEVDASWLAVIAGTFAADPRLDVVTGRVLPLPPEGDRIHPVASRLSTRRRDFDRYRAPWVVGSGNNFAVRRATYLRIGGCDERLGPGSPARGGVDMDLFYRLLRAGARIRYEPDSIVHHGRQSRAQRLARRPMYGMGMGACCALRLRERDGHALRLLADWMWLRLRQVAHAARRADGGALHEEWLMLRGTVTGLRHGLRAAARPPSPHSPTSSQRGADPGDRTIW
ncbi:MAG TPA: glycosyltransferase family A protein [Gemmatimonadales bacterium]